MEKEKQLYHYVQNFFQDYLSVQRGVSINTILTYRDTLQLFLIFTIKYLNKDSIKLTLDDLTMDVALAFLKNLEDSRKNKIVTRNNRLAALRTFFTYLANQDPLHAVEYQRIIAIPIKKAPQQPITYLEINEVKTILETIDQSTLLGKRDYTILYLFHNTGARVTEICDLLVENIRLESPPLVSLTGKGKKTRQIPLWEDAATLLKNYMIDCGIIQNPKAKVFMSTRGTPLNRFSVRRMIQRRAAAANKKCPTLSSQKITPHTFRHTTAMHLLQSGVDLTVIKTWLGHVNMSTTHMYVEIDLEMKRKALSACTPIGEPQKLQKVIQKNEDVVEFLNTLRTRPLCELKSQTSSRETLAEFT